MADQLLGAAVFVSYAIVVSLALWLAVVVFRTGDDGAPPDRPAGARDRSRSWWRRWR